MAEEIKNDTIKDFLGNPIGRGDEIAFNTGNMGRYLYLDTVVHIKKYKTGPTIITSNNYRVHHEHLIVAKKKQPE